MTASTVAVAPPRGLLSEVQPRKVLMWGLVGGIAAVFISAIGMLEIFDRRKIIDPFLNLGYAVLLWIPLYLGYSSSKRPVLEGIEPPRPGAHNVVAGAVTGALSGLITGIFLVIADLVNLRGILINLTPRTLELLGPGEEPVTGALILIAAAAVVGTLGGALHLLPPRYLSALWTGMLWVFLVAFLELLIGNVLRQVGLIGVDGLIYQPSRGLTPVAALLVFAGAIAFKLTLATRASQVFSRFEEIPDTGRRRIMLGLALLLLALGSYLPSLLGTLLNELLSNVGLFILLALGLNIVVGYAGLLDLGYVAFFAVGAYTTAILTSPRSPKITPELAFFEALPWVLLMAAIAGLIIGTPVIRMRGDYLAIVTLGFGEIARLLFLSDWLDNVFGAAQGILGISPLGTSGSGIRVNFGYVVAAAGIIVLIVGFLRWREAGRIERAEADPIPGVSYSTGPGMAMMVGGIAAIAGGLAFPTFLTWTVIGINPPSMFRIILVFVAIAAFVSWRLEGSRVGRAWMAVREDEQVAQTMGVNTVTNKLLAFVMGAMLASFGGALFAVKLGTIFPHSFEIVQSIIILVVVIVGGMGSLRGVALGAVVLIGILGGPTQPGLLREFGEFKLLLYGAILVWMMLQRPEGLLPSARRARELHEEEEFQDAWLQPRAAAPAESGGGQ